MANVVNKVVGKEGCDSCGSKDNVAIYSDGGKWCFTPGCASNTDRTVSNTGEKKFKKPWIAEGSYRDIANRGLKAETCTRHKYHYTRYSGVISMNGEPVELKDTEVAVYNTYNVKGELTGQKVRGPNKTFWWNNSPEEKGLLGSWLWSDSKKQLIITEGIEDMMACDEALGYLYNVGSVHDGAGSAARDITANYDRIMKHERIIVFMDNDAAGKTALEQIKKLIPPYKLCIVQSEYKDACVLHKLDKDTGSSNLKFVLLTANPTPPISLVRAGDIPSANLLVPNRKGYKIKPFPGLNSCLDGFAKGELTIFTGGEKLGKTDFLATVEHALITEHQLKIESIKLEAKEEVNFSQLLAIELKLPLKAILQGDIHVTDEMKQPAIDKLCPYVNFYNYSEGMDIDSLLDYLNYAAIVSKCDFITIDNLTKLMASVKPKSGNMDERKSIDTLLAALTSFCDRTGVGVLLLVHLKHPDTGRSWKQGRTVTEGNMRGSGSISYFPDNLICLEGQTRPYVTKFGVTVFDPTVRWIRVLASRYGRKSDCIADVYRRNPKTWELEYLDKSYFGNLKTMEHYASGCVVGREVDSDGWTMEE